MKIWRFYSYLALIYGVTLSIASIAHANPSLQNGKQIDQEKCVSCHAKKSSFGSGDMIYTRTDSKVTSFAKLKAMVGMCNSELRLDLFPEDEADVVAYLNHQFYKFKTNQK
jgi:hypothetical protein